MDFTHAACKGQVDLFYDERPESMERAKQICRHCFVSQECLSLALENGEAWGIWGGTDYRERTAIAASKGYPIPERFDTIEHGTPRGHAQHAAQGIPLDDFCGCLEAYRAASRERMRKHREKKRKDQAGEQRNPPGPFTGDQT